MHIRVMLDICQPLKCREKIILANGKEQYVQFEYDKLTLFCFIYDRLSHGESFCPIRVTNNTENITFELDLSLRAPNRRNTTPKNIWLREPVGIHAFNIGHNSCSNMGNQDPDANYANSSTTNLAHTTKSMRSSPNFASPANFMRPAPPSFPIIDMSNVGPTTIMDIAMNNATEDSPLDQIEAAKRQRTQFSP
ncbi:hypothetical protein V6N13_001302 [Hibiscus sabdariffa]